MLSVMIPANVRSRAVRVAPMLVLWAGAALALAATTSAQTTAPKFDSTKAYEHVRRLVGFGPRPSGSRALEQTRAYIAEQFSAMGVASTKQEFDAKTPVGPIRMANVIATIPGERRDRLLITGHYDTKRFDQFRFVGANDGGSSAAFLLEMARALKQRRNRLTMELVFFDGEEAVIEWRDGDHTYGSQYYVDAARKAGTLASVRALILVDMIGDRDLVIKRELNSTPWLTDIIWGSARRLSVERYFPVEGTRIEDDHMPFLQAGVPAVDLIDLVYDAWHTQDDTLEHVGARSLQVVGDVLLDAIPRIEARLLEKKAH